MLPEGITNYEFSFNLKAELPSSFSGSSGKIKYKIEFVVDKPWKFDEKQVIVLNIIQTVNLNHTLSSLQPFENQLTRNIGYIGTGPISLHVFVPKCGYIHGDKIVIQVTMTIQIVFLTIFLTFKKTIKSTPLSNNVLFCTNSHKHINDSQSNRDKF